MKGGGSNYGVDTPGQDGGASRPRLDGAGGCEISSRYFAWCTIQTL